MCCCSGCEQCWNRDVRGVTTGVHGDDGSSSNVVAYNDCDAASRLCPLYLVKEAASTTAQQDDLASDLRPIIQTCDADLRLGHRAISVDIAFRMSSSIIKSFVPTRNVATSQLSFRGDLEAIVGIRIAAESAANPELPAQTFSWQQWAKRCRSGEEECGVIVGQADDG